MNEGRDGQLARGCRCRASRRADVVPPGVPCLPKLSLGFSVGLGRGRLSRAGSAVALEAPGRGCGERLQ